MRFQTRGLYSRDLALFTLPWCCPKYKDLVEFKNWLWKSSYIKIIYKIKSWLWPRWLTEYTHMSFQIHHTEMLNKLKWQKLLHHWAWKIGRENIPELENKKIINGHINVTQCCPCPRCCHTTYLAQDWGLRAGTGDSGGPPNTRKLYLGTSQNLKPQKDIHFS